MKKLILVGLISLGSTLFADSSLGVRVQGVIGNTLVGINFRSDDHRYDNRYKNFDYDRYGYFDNYGYYYGYFDTIGYFFNNIFFLYDSNYTYYDRLHRIGNFRPNHAHYRKYKYTKGNSWNKEHKYRNENEMIYGHYYDKNPTPQYTKQSNKNMKKNENFKNNNQKNVKEKTDYKKSSPQKNDNRQKNDRFKDDRGDSHRR